MLNHTTGEEVVVLQAELDDHKRIIAKVQINEEIGLVRLGYWEPIIVPEKYSSYRLEILIELSNYIEMEEKSFWNKFEYMRMKILTFG